ncbi:MAG TPA: hypothetical protein VGM64_12405 [Lacunisphaera sp.]|jgi:PHD/YefM family antitoxin component YafN of YafNO toxin-antitoxin module
MKAATKRPASSYVPREEPTLVVNENGTAAYLVEAKTYETMQRRLRLLEGLARGEKAIAEGKVFSHLRAQKRMARWLK